MRALLSLVPSQIYTLPVFLGERDQITTDGCEATTTLITSYTAAGEQRPTFT